MRLGIKWARAVLVCAMYFNVLPAAGDVSLTVKGAAIVEEKCAKCHAVGLDGDSTHKDAPPFRFVVTKYPPETLAEALVEGITTGHPDMPLFTFGPDEIDAIIAYLETLGTPAASEEPQ